MQPRKVYRQVPNFNLIPSEYQKPTISGRRLGLRLLVFVVIVAEILFTQNLYREKSALEAVTVSTQQQIQQIEEKLNLVNEIKALAAERQTLADDWRELTTKQADWPRVLTALFQSQPREIKLSALGQDGNRLNATGTASDYTALVEYRRALLASPAISHIVSLQSAKSESAISFAMVVELKIGVGE